MRAIEKLVAGVSCFLAIALAGSLVAPLSGAAAANWTLRQLPPQPLDDGSTSQIVLYGASCPSDSLCLAVGPFDTIASSRAPAGGADQWHVVHPKYDEPKQACLEEDQPEGFCDSPRGTIRGVSCATESLCVAVGYEGSVFTSTDPAGGANAWRVSDLNEGPGASHLTGVSCPSPSFCAAVSGGYGGSTGRVFTSTDPAGGKWQTIQLGGSPDLRGVSCATASLCVAVADEGRSFVSSNPTAGASAWRQAASPTPRDLFAVSCVAATLCAAGDAGGNILTSTDLTGGGSFAVAKAGSSVQITGLTCPEISNCVAVTNNADVLTSTDPTGGSEAWTFENLVPFEAVGTGGSSFVKNALFGASCASTSLCVLVGAESRIFTAADPFAAPTPSATQEPGESGRLRPRTVILFAEGFWKNSVTHRHRVKARFRFYSRDGAHGFVCKPDSGRWRRCRSPLRYWAPTGRHALRVRAIGRTGLRGPAATLRFRVIHR
ncbi:MAG: WD40/YVTN/BNR-like repeat-containing protein [Solirubrobacterales bacterium]